MRVNPGVLHSASFAKYAVAFFRISFSRLSRTFSARSRDSSICSGVTALAPAPLSLPACGRLDPVAQRLLDQPKLLGHRANRLAILHPLDRQFLELGGVFLLRYLFIFLLPSFRGVIPHLLEEVPQGALTGRVPLARHTRYARGARRDTSSSFTRVRQTQIKQQTPYAMAFTPRLAVQWQELIHHKTRIDDDDQGGRGDRAWRLKTIERVSTRVTPAMLTDGQVCVTAGVQWGQLCSYLGWLCLPRPVGLGLTTDSADTLAWLSDAESLRQYVRWMERRSANTFHNGINVFLQTVESHLRPQTGFVWLRHDLAATVHPCHHARYDSQSSNWQDLSGWRARCEATRLALRKYRQFRSGTKPIPRSRNPVERVAVVLNDEFPLKRLVEFVNALERSMPPPAHHRDYCAWIRDVVLCRLLLSNPLRIGQYAAMTYRADGNGHLVRVGPGRYRLNFEPSDFKNERGAATHPYSVAVDDSVAPWIDRYLTEARPYLVGADETSRFLLPAARGPRQTPQFLRELRLSQQGGYLGEGLSTRIKRLTSLYIDECPGFGPHAFRHVIATDHLRRNPGDYLTVATLLHDKLETVLKNYSHLTVQDGLRRLSTGIQLAQEQLTAARNAPPLLSAPER